MLAYRPRLLAALLVLAGAATVQAAPRDELLRYVPDDAGFCLVVQDLRGQLKQLAESPFARQWGKTALGASLAGAGEWQKLALAEGYLKKHLGVGWAELRDEVLGDAFVFAYRPGPPGKPEQDQGVFLLRASNDRTLARLVDRLNQLQKSTGELKDLQRREHRGVTYTCRVERKEKNYYLLKGRVLLYTGQEALLREAIDKDQALAQDAVPALSRRLRELGLDGALVAVAIGPRALDAHMAEKSDPGSKAISRIWRAVDGIGLGLHVQRDLQLTLTIKARGSLASRLLRTAARASELWGSIPDGALFAVAGRVDLTALYEALGEFLSKSGRQTLEGELERTLGAVLGKNVVKEVLPALGPDWGVWVTAPPATSKEWAPRVMAAVRVARGEENDPIDQAVFSSVVSWAQLAVLGHNKLNPTQALTLKSADGGRLRFLQGEGVFPPGVQPAFGLRQGYLVLASSPAEWRRFKLGAPLPAGMAIPLLRVSFKDWRAYLKERRDVLAGVLGVRDKLPREKTLEKLDGLRAVLELVDRLELRRQVGDDRLTFTLAVQTAQPLKK
jgi:hypothetical protein